MSIRIYIYLIIVQKIRSFFSDYPDNLTRKDISGALAGLFFVHLFATSSRYLEAVLKRFLKLRRNFSCLYRGFRYFTDECFEHHVAHTFHELNAADNKVSATADSTAGYLILELPDHPGNIHEHAA
jgi:hypothetical protein